MSVPTVSHKVKKGETLASIAKTHGFTANDQKKIFAAKYNAKLRKVRKGPDTVEVGDIVNVPVVTAAEMDDLIRKLKTWHDDLDFSRDPSRELKEVELDNLKKDRDLLFSHVEWVLKRLEAAPKIDPATRRAARDCEIWFDLHKSLTIPQTTQCVILLSEAARQKREYRKKLKALLNRELRAIKEVQKEIWAIETSIAKSDKIEKDAQTLLMAAISAAKKLKASMF